MELLAQELERQRESRMDVIVHSKDMFAQPDEKSVSLGFLRPRALESDAQVPGDEMEIMPLSDWAHNQVATKLDIPLKYYKKMQERSPELLAKNINEWLPDKNKLLLRTMDGNVRAVLSDRYKIMDNHDLLLSCLEEFKDMGAELHRADLTVIQARLNGEEPEFDEENDMWTKSIYIGSVMGLLPSGKYYMPFACSNVHICKTCKEAGSVPCTEDNPCVYSPGDDDDIGEDEDAPDDWHCEACKDARWFEQAEKELNSIDAYMFSGEGDATDLFIGIVVESGDE